MRRKKPKVLLLALYTEGMRMTFEELGICSIASYLRAHGYEVMVMGKTKEQLDYAKIMDYLPDIVGFSLYSTSKHVVFSVCEELHGRIPQVYLCVGGTLATHNHRGILQETPYIDSVLRGEGEEVFLNLVRCVEEKGDFTSVNGLTYRKDAKIYVNKDQELIKDLDSLPVPARDILVENNLKIAQISTSRGCKARCTFCASQLFWSCWRGRSVKSIVDEIESIINTHQIHAFYFIDGSFEDPSNDYSRLIKIAKEIIRRNLKICYFANFRAEFCRKTTPELMELLVKSGLSAACIGIEAANTFDLKLYGKRATLEENIKIIALFNKYGVNIQPGFININPYSTFENLRKNIDFLEKYKFLSIKAILFNRYNMLINTPLYQKIVRDKLLMKGKFNEDGYYFVDERIGVFINFIEKYVSSIGHNSNKAIDRISYFCNDFLSIFLYAKRHIQQDCKDKVRELLDVFEVKLDQLRIQANKLIAKWYRELLDLAENQWHDQKAMEISDKYLGSKDMIQIANYMDNIKNIMYIGLMRHNTSYSHYFIHLF